MKRAALALLAALTLALAACSAPPPPTSGTITGMTHEPGHYETEYSTVCVAYDSKTFACSSSITTSYEVWHEPTWAICLRSDTDPKHVGCVLVPQDVYGNYTVGGHYPDAR